jgi:DNA transposition AAA+ family ATPase
MSDVRQRLREFQENSPQFSLTKIARELAVSQGTLSQWLKGTYPGNNERIEKAVD